jgi:hypothetical protein
MSSHVVIKVEAYRAQTSLMQCYDCQIFGHVWANCKQPPDAHGVEAATSIKYALNRTRRHQFLSAATASWLRGKKLRPSNCRSCCHAKEELLRRKAQQAPAKNPPGRQFSSRLTTPNLFFAACSPRKPAVAVISETAAAEARISKQNRKKSVRAGDNIKANSASPSTRY